MSTETPAQRDARGRRMAIQAGLETGDMEYLANIEAQLEGRELDAFRQLYGSRECRGVAGIRPAADLALAKMRERVVRAVPGNVTWRST
jgi:hypothetical protein